VPTASSQVATSHSQQAQDAQLTAHVCRKHSNVWKRICSHSCNCATKMHQTVPQCYHASTALALETRRNMCKRTSATNPYPSASAVTHTNTAMQSKRRTALWEAAKRGQGSRLCCCRCRAPCTMQR
jgi:hypothetical protein